MAISTKTIHESTNSIEHVLFIAPSLPYARTIVRNLASTLNRKGIPFNSSNVNSWDTPFINTAHVTLTFVYCDPVEWTASTFCTADRIFGKKALLENLRGKSFTPRQALPIECGSLERYIIATEADFDYRILDNKPPKTSYLPEISKVHFNYPMTIVIWEDGTKTMVECQDGDLYSEEVGLALCIAKKALGNKGNFNNVFRKWVPIDLDDGIDNKEEK